MKTIGVVKRNKQDYVFIMDMQKTITYYYLYNVYHKEDRKARILGSEPKYPIRDLATYQHEACDDNYLNATIIRKNIGGDLQYYGEPKLLLQVIQLMQKSLAYTFAAQDVTEDITEFSNAYSNIVRTFKANDGDVMLEFEKMQGNFISYFYRDKNFYIEFKERTQGNYPKHKSFKDRLVNFKSSEVGNDLYYSNVKSIDYDAVLSQMEDTTWYFENDSDGVPKFKKDYYTVKTEEEFENLVVNLLVEEIKKARKEGTLPVLIGLDTETDGLDIFNIDKELQSKVVAIPIAWKDDSAAIIYTDMAYFENVGLDYVKERLEPFLRKDILDDSPISIQTKDGEFEFKRSEVFVTGHNIMFDKKAFAVHDIDVYFDADTMQMSFTLDPFLTKRKNGLKHITHKLLNCSTVELTDVLGKGNEDKFRYINDERVSRLYGCADADFSRLIFIELKKIFKECESFHGRDLLKTELEQDVLLMNALAMADFDGIRINREVFIEKGKDVLQDIQTVTEFAHKYVGRVIAANNHLLQCEMLKANDVDISTLPTPNLENAPPYEFKFSGNSLKDTLFQVLKYPVLAMTEPSKAKVDKGEAVDFKPQPAVNKIAMKKLMDRRLKKPNTILKADILGSGGDVLISAEDFNSFKYPVAYLVSLIGPRKKEYDSYFKPFIEQSYGNMLCKSSKFSAIDTRRIANPTQTIKGKLKQYMLPYDDSYAMCDFDMSQVELRIMASLAADIGAVENMKDPEADSHTETAAAINFKEAYQVSNKERKAAKSVNFGYPYGLMRPSMCEKIFGDKSNEHLAETAKLIETFEKVKHQVVGYLNDIRKQTIEEVSIPDCLREYLELPKDMPVGVVRNLKGFYKLFQLDDLTDQKAARIGRQSGNFPIQAFASELFRIILIRAYKSFWNLGWIQKGWVKWHIVIHDELLLSYKKDKIHPVELAKVIHEACTISIDGHTNYYIGINIGNTWGDCKADERELPVHMVTRLIERWDNGDFDGEVVLDPQNYLNSLRQKYISDRIYEVISKDNPKLSKEYVNCNQILECFTNYTVRKYVYECYKPLWKVEEDDDSFDACLASWALERFGDDTTFTLSNGKSLILNAGMYEQQSELVNLETINTVDDDEDYYSELSWDLDGSGASYIVDYDDSDDATFEDEFDAGQGTTFESMRVFKQPQLKHITLIGKKAKILIKRKQDVAKIESLIVSNQLNETEGVQIYYSSPVVHSKGSFVNAEQLHFLDSILCDIGY